MRKGLIFAALTAATLLLGAAPGQAVDNKAVVAATASSSANSGTNASAKASAKPASAGKPEAKSAAKPPANAKLVDINSAPATELKTLPGIKDGEAAKIISGRPYGSKAQLETRGVLDAQVYEGLKKQVIAKQPVDASSKNTAASGKQK